MIKLYHGTSRCLAEKIIKEGFQSHTWFASNEKRARVFGKLKDGIPVVLVIELSEEELQKRLLVSQYTPKEKLHPEGGMEYLLGNYWGGMPKKRLRPINQGLSCMTV